MPVCICDFETLRELRHRDRDRGTTRIIDGTPGGTLDRLRRLGLVCCEADSHVWRLTMAGQERLKAMELEPVP